MNKRVMAVVTAVASIVLIAAALWWHYRTDQQVKEVKELRAELYSKATRELPEDERREKFLHFREQIDKLSVAQRRQVRQQMSAGYQQRMYGQIRNYFELPESKRAAFLDKQINEMEKRRKQMAGRGREGQAVFRGRGARDSARGSLSESERQARRDRFKRSWLDSTTPRQRAEMSEYLQALRRRREQRGLPDRGHGLRRG